MAGDALVLAIGRRVIPAEAITGQHPAAEGVPESPKIPSGSLCRAFSAERTRIPACGKAFERHLLASILAASFSALEGGAKHLAF
jgi:hypothetical protein